MTYNTKLFSYKNLIQKNYEDNFPNIKKMNNFLFHMQGQAKVLKEVMIYISPPQASNVFNKISTTVAFRNELARDVPISQNY